MRPAYDLAEQVAQRTEYVCVLDERRGDEHEKDHAPQRPLLLVIHVLHSAKLASCTLFT